MQRYSISLIACFLNKKVSAIFYFRIFGIVLRFNSGVHVFGDIIMPSPLRYRGFYYWNYVSESSNGGIICRVEECETRYRQTLKTLMADPSSPLQST